MGTTDDKGKKQTKRQQSVAQQMRRIAEKIAELATEHEIIDDEKYFYLYDVSNKLMNLGQDAQLWITRMLNKGYLVIKETDPESYYIFTSYKKGRKFKRRKK